MRKFIYIFLFIIVILSSKIKLSASSEIDLCVVYEKNSYEKGDIVSLSFDLPKFSNLFGVIIRVEYDKEIFNANGNLTYVYDKYGDLYLSYTYNSSNQLISVTYNGKTINFSYSSNQLNKIEYEETETTLLYQTNSLTINHYSGTKYECINETNKYTVNALLGTSILSTKSCEYTNNQSVLTYYDDNEEIEKLTYDFLDSYSNGNGSHSYIQVTNKLDVKQVMQFKNRKLLYSFEFLDDELNENDYYEKTVTIYDINNKLNNGTFTLG